MDEARLAESEEEGCYEEGRNGEGLVKKERREGGGSERVKDRIVMKKGVEGEAVEG